MKVCAEIIIFCLFLQLTCCFESNLCEEKSQQKTSEDFKFLQEENKALRSELEKLKEARSSPLTRRKRQICDDAGHTSRLEKQVADCLDTNRGFQTSINELEATLNSISASQPKNCPTTAPVQPIVQPNCQAHTRRLKEINENLLSEVFNKFGPTCKIVLGFFSFF